MGVIIDTNLLVAGEKADFDLTAFVQALEPDEVAIAAITVAELLHGVERAVTPRIKEARTQYVEGILDAFPILSYGVAEAREHARIWAHMTSRGTLIGAHDFIVAATALAVGFAVATLNQREFERVPGLLLAPVRGG